MINKKYKIIDKRREWLDLKIKQNNSLNLLAKGYKILIISKDLKWKKVFTSNLIELKNELEKLKIINDIIWMYLTEN